MCVCAQAVRDKKSIYITTLDFAKAFDSVPHNLITWSLKKIGFPKYFIKTIKDLYTDTKTRIEHKGKPLKWININRGVRQGCPFSPTLFNLCLEPLLKAIQTKNKRDSIIIENKVKEDNYLFFNVQAYADDVILMTSTQEGMENMLKTVEEYCEIFKLKIAPQKCKSLSYIYNNGARTTLNECFKINNEEIPNHSLFEHIEYLGAPIAINRNNKKQHSQIKINKVKQEINQVVSSPLKFNQIIDAIKRIITPQLDFEMLNGLCSMKELRKLDSYIRGAINKCLNTKGLPKDLFYTHYKEGGFSLISFVERYNALQLRTLTGLMLSKSQTIRDFMRTLTINEIAYRGVKLINDGPYFGTPLDEKGKIIQSNTNKTNCLFYRAVKAMFNLQIKFHPDLDEDCNMINIKIADLNKDKKEEEEENEELVDEKSIMNYLNNTLRKRHLNNLKKLQFKAHTFNAMDKSTDSNFFMANFRAPTSDNIIKFAILARCNNLPTNEILNKNNPNIDPICHRCNKNCNDSLMHRINGCNKIKNLTTKRHNAIVEEIIKGIEKCNKNNNNIIFNRNTKVIDREHKTISNLKPDIWYINNNKLTLIEVNSPYGSIDNKENEPKSTLVIRREEKINKYKDYIELCKNRLNLKVELYVIVISSLGIIPKETNKDLMKLFDGNKKVLHLTARRCVVAALRESMLIFYRIYEKSKNNHNQNNITQNEATQNTELEQNPDYQTQYNVIDNSNFEEEDDDEENDFEPPNNTQEELIEELSEELLNSLSEVVGEKVSTTNNTKAIRRSHRRAHVKKPANNGKKVLSRYMQFVLAAKKNKKENESRKDTKTRKKRSTKNKKRTKSRKMAKSNKTVSVTAMSNDEE